MKWSRKIFSCVLPSEPGCSASQVLARWGGEAKDLLFIVRSCVFSASALAIALSLHAQAPSAVPVANEPHHHQVLKNSYVSVLRVSIPGKSATLLHQHDFPYVYVSLGVADIINAIAGRPEAHVVLADGQVGFSPGHFAHIARTDAGSPFDNVTIELLKPQGEVQNLCERVVPEAGTGPCKKTTPERGYSIEPLFETEAMEADLIRLEPAAKQSGIAPKIGMLVVALNESQVRVAVEGKSAETRNAGEVAWLDSGTQDTISNPQKKGSSLLVLNFKDGSEAAKR